MRLLDEALRILVTARDRLRRGWCRESLAEDRFGSALLPRDPRAVAWCLLGSMCGGYSIEASRCADDAVSQALLNRGYGDLVARANDIHVKDQQMAVEIMEEAISICRAASEEGE